MSRREADRRSRRRGRRGRWTSRRCSALLERLRAGAGERQRARGDGDARTTTDVFDDDEELNDVLAELDGPALLRVQRSLAGTTL